MFSPVRRVAYHVENTRVGQQTDLDRLIVRIWTDGSAEPQAVLDKAVDILRDELSVFGNVETVQIEPQTQAAPVMVASTYEPNPTPSLSINPQPYANDLDSNPRVTLEGLGLTTRVLHSLKEEGIDSVDALCALSDRDLKKVPGIGERSLDEIKVQLAQFGLALKD